MIEIKFIFKDGYNMKSLTLKHIESIDEYVERVKNDQYFDSYILFKDTETRIGEVFIRKVCKHCKGKQ